jgi:AraC-like DNA-binding protein
MKRAPPLSGQFRAATAMSPFRYQKSLRPQQARRLLIADEDASRAGYAVPNRGVFSHIAKPSLPGS